MGSASRLAGTSVALLLLAAAFPSMGEPTSGPGTCCSICPLPKPLSWHSATNPWGPCFHLYAGRTLLEEAQIAGLEPPSEHWTGGGRQPAVRRVASLLSPCLPCPAGLPTVVLPSDTLGGDGVVGPSPLLEVPLAEDKWVDAGGPPVNLPGGSGFVTVQPRIINGEASWASIRLGWWGRGACCMWHDLVLPPPSGSEAQLARACRAQ